MVSSPVSAAEVNGWLTGGTGVVAGATPPIIGDPETSIRWKTATSNWGNASPVRFGSMICITEEPVLLSCYDRDTGQKKWSATNRYTDTLPAAEQAEMPTILATLARDTQRQEVIRSQMGMVQRELRRSTSGSDVQERYDNLMNELNAIVERKTRYAAHLLSDEHGIIGYGTATPTVSGGYIYVLFGNGVLSKFSSEGKRQWSVWMGPPIRPMRGYHTGTAASILMAEGVLIVPFAHLRGINPKDGSVLWKGEEYRHYGTPALANVGGSSVVVTPGGELIDPKDGEEVGDPLAAIEFIGPMASGDLVYVIGHTRYPNSTVGSHATAYKLQRNPDGRVASTMLWEKKLSKHRIYGAPLVTDERLYVLYNPGDVDVLNAKTGATISSFEGGPNARNGSPSIVLGGDRMLLSFEVGEVRTYSAGDEPKLLGRKVIEVHRSTALLDGARIYIRGLQHLYCIE